MILINVSSLLSAKCKTISVRLKSIHSPLGGDNIAVMEPRLEQEENSTKALITDNEGR